MVFAILLLLSGVGAHGASGQESWQFPDYPSSTTFASLSPILCSESGQLFRGVGEELFLYRGTNSVYRAASLPSGALEVVIEIEQGGGPGEFSIPPVGDLD